LWEVPVNELKPESVVPFVLSPREGRAAGATMTVVNDATGGRVTVRFRRPEGFTSVLVDVMDGSDNETSFSFVGSVRVPRGEGAPFVSISRHAKAEGDRSRKAKTILDWTFRAAEGGDLRTVRALHSGCCGRCGRKLTVPESIDTGLGPVCARS